MSKSKRYQRRVFNARQRIERDERQAKGIKTEAEKAVDDVLRKVLGADHPAVKDGG